MAHRRERGLLVLEEAQVPRFPAADTSLSLWMAVLKEDPPRPGDSTQVRRRGGALPAQGLPFSRSGNSAVTRERTSGDCCRRVR
jgi:hypothetical protein